MNVKETYDEKKNIIIEPYKGWQVEVIASCCDDNQHRLRIYRDKIDKCGYPNYIVGIFKERLTFWNRIKEAFRQIKFYLFQYYWERPKEEIQITPEQAIDLSQKLKNDAEYFINKQKQTLEYHKYMVEEIENNYRKQINKINT